MRIKQADLEMQVRRINNIKNVKHGYNIKGCYHIDYAYGVALHKYTGSNGSVTDISRMGHVTKKELHIFMNGFITALTDI